MTTYATYRHIELDKVGYGKKRVHNPSSEIFNVLCTPPSKNSSAASSGSSTPRRHSYNNDSFTRLFGNSETTPTRKSSFKKGAVADVTHRNPVTGNGVTSWDQRKSLSPKVRTERNPVTGEVYTIVSPATTPTQPVQNGFSFKNGESTPIQNGHTETPQAKSTPQKPLTNGHA